MTWTDARTITISGDVGLDYSPSGTAFDLADEAIRLVGIRSDLPGEGSLRLVGHSVDFDIVDDHDLERSGTCTVSLDLVDLDSGGDDAWQTLMTVRLPQCAATEGILSVEVTLED